MLVIYLFTKNYSRIFSNYKTQNVKHLQFESLYSNNFTKKL